jgi:hypothetical protein
MDLDVKARLSNKFWARHLVDTVAMWLKCNSTPPFRVDSRRFGSNPVGHRADKYTRKSAWRQESGAKCRKTIPRCCAFVVTNQAEFNQLR